MRDDIWDKVPTGEQSQAGGDTTAANTDRENFHNTE